MTHTLFYHHRLYRLYWLQHRHCGVWLEEVLQQRHLPAFHQSLLQPHLRPCIPHCIHISHHIPTYFGCFHWIYQRKHLLLVLLHFASLLHISVVWLVICLNIEHLLLLPRCATCALIITVTLPFPLLGADYNITITLPFPMKIYIGVTYNIKPHVC